MPTLQKYKNGFFLVLPKEHVDYFGWKAGTKLYVVPAGYNEKKLLIQEILK